MALLQKGDKVAFVAPSSCIKKEDIEKSLLWFKQQDIDVELMPHVFDCKRYMAGTDKNRAADINLCFLRNDIKALFCVRGGAGSAKILDYIDYQLVKNNPKPVFGLSDSTALQNALFSQAQNVSYSGFLPAYDFKYTVLNDNLQKSLKNIFQGKSYIINGGKKLISGVAEGVVVGGCLSVFCQLCGTKFFPNLTDKILLLEDVGEKTYKLELMLNQLRQQKGFESLKGLIFGQFKNCCQADECDGSVDDIIEDFVSEINIPTICGINYGHEFNRCIMPIGKKVKMNTDEGYVEIY